MAQGSRSGQLVYHSMIAYFFIVQLIHWSARVSLPHAPAFHIDSEHEYSAFSENNNCYDYGPWSDIWQSSISHHDRVIEEKKNELTKDSEH